MNKPSFFSDVSTSECECNIFMKDMSSVSARLKSAPRDRVTWGIKGEAVQSKLFQEIKSKFMHLHSPSESQKQEKHQPVKIKYEPGLHHTRAKSDRGRGNHHK